MLCGRRRAHVGKQTSKRLGYNSGYAVSMKTAVSVSDDLFCLAEATARRLRVSRSELYAKAIAEFLKQRTEMRSRNA